MATIFCFMAIATIIGGFGHLFSFYCGVWLKVLSWILVLITLAFLEKNMLKLIVLPRFIHFIPPIKCAISIFLTLKFQNFTPTKTSLTLGMVFIVCPILFYQYFILLLLFFFSLGENIGIGLFTFISD